MADKPSPGSVSEAMIEAGVRAWHENEFNTLEDDCRDIYLAMEAARTTTIPASEAVVERVRKLAAEIMVAVRQARFPKEYAAEAHDEFEALTLAPMLAEALSATANHSAPIGDDLKARWDAAKPCLADDEWMLANDTLDRIEELERENERLKAAEDRRAERGKRELEHYYATTCPCDAAERYVPTCPKHGFKEQERG